MANSDRIGEFLCRALTEVPGLKAAQLCRGIYQAEGPIGSHRPSVIFDCPDQCGREFVNTDRELRINALTLDAVKLLRRLIGEDIQLILELDAKEDCVSGDRGQIEQQGYRVFIASESAEAVASFDAEGGKVGLLLTDVVMPNGFGPDLYEQPLQRRPELKVLFMSGYTTRTILWDRVLKPGHPFLQKPLSMDHLLRTIRAILDRPGQ